MYSPLNSKHQVFIRGRRKEGIGAAGWREGSFSLSPAKDWHFSLFIRLSQRRERRKRSRVKGEETERKQDERKAEK